MIYYPTIYYKETTDYHHEGLGVLTDFVNDVEVIENTNGYFEVKFSYHMNGQNAEYLKEQNQIKVKPSPKQDPTVFIIYDVEHDFVDHIIYVVAEHKILYDLKSVQVKSSKINAPSAEIAIENAIKQADHELDIVTTGSSYGRVVVEYEESTPYEIIFGSGGIVDLSGVELTLKDDRIVTSQHRGHKNATLIRDRDFLQEFKLHHQQTDDMVTRVIPFTTTQSDYTKRVDDGRLEKKTKEEKVYGTPIWSPNINDFGYPLITKYVEYRNETLEETTTINHTYGDNRDQEIELSKYKYQNVTDLDKEAKDFFIDNAGVDEFKIESHVELLGLYRNYRNQLQPLELYDSASFYIERFDKEIELMVKEVVYNPLINQVTKLSFETDAVSLSEARRRLDQGKLSSSALSESIKNANDKYNERIELVDFLYNHKGSKRSYVTELPDPRTAKEGDLAFLEKGERIEIWEFKNGGWFYYFAVNNEEYVRDKIKEMEEQAEVLRKEMEEADRRAKEILKNIPDGDELRKKFGKIDENTHLVSQIMGDENMMLYSKNWVDVDIDTSEPIIIKLEDERFCFEASMGHLTPGVPVTVSGVSRFIERDGSQVTVHFDEWDYPNSKVVLRFEEI